MSTALITFWGFLWKQVYCQAQTLVRDTLYQRLAPVCRFNRKVIIVNLKTILNLYMNVNFYQYDKYIIYILYTIYYNTYFVMVPGRLCISVSILSDTESSVCIRCLIPLQRYLISLMLSSRTEQRRQSECKKTTSSTYSQHPFQGHKTDAEKENRNQRQH